MPRIGDLVLERPYTLHRPILQAADAWLQPLLAGRTQLNRADFAPHDLKPFMAHASLFDLIYEGDKVVDFRIRVMASHVAADVAELSGKKGSAHLPPALFERWLQIAGFMLQVRAPFCARALVVGRQNKRTENLVVPVVKDGKLAQALVFSEYWYEPI